ncbi:MAG: Ig-like domain-containing protein [bacterium]|nr:Ig-like domain-containing protein [bacterium]
MSSRRFMLLALLLGLALAAASCSDDDPADPAADTTAPLVVSAHPAQGEDDVDLDETVIIAFNEDMAPATTAGLVTLSHGTVTGLTWTNARTLAVEHTDWPEGTEVTATATTGLTDAAGNALGAAFAWDFWTWTDEVLLLGTTPADGAVNVPINTTVWLQFSQGMDGATLPGAITVTSPDKVDHAYTLESSESDSEWVLTFTDDLPASTLITVTVSTDAESSGGTPLADATSFSFTTGTNADLTPPQLVSAEPANGATIATDTSFFRMTFSEPIDDNSVSPSLISGQLMSAFTSMDNPGVWSENNTVITVGLRAPLIPGSIFRVEFASFADVHGNVNDDGYAWQATVAGTAQFFPVVDGWVQYLAGYYEETDNAKTSGEIEELQVIEVKTGGEFWLWHTENHNSDPAKDLPEMEEYDRMKVTASAIQLLGFHEEHDMESSDITFTPPIDWLRVPVQTGSWSGTSTFADGEDEMEVDFVGSVLAGTYDVPMGGMDRKQDDGPPVVWLGCRKVTMHYELGDGVEVFSTGNDTVWYAPGAGLVREISHEVQEERTYHSDKTLMWAGFEADFPSR